MIFVVSCEPNLNDEFEPSSGETDLTTFISIGNSLTAGFADGALYRSGQIYSFPNILAAHFSYVGGGIFNQPLMPTDEGVGIQITDQGIVFNTKYILGYQKDCEGNYNLAPVLFDPDASQATLAQRLNASVAAHGPFNNLGIPGIKSFNPIYPGLGLNPYFTRLAPNPTDTLINLALEQQPTFFSLWLGSNDVLNYAIAGGTSDSITPQPTFASAMEAIVQYLTAGGAKGAIANIPDIKVMPYFTTIPYNAIVLTDQNTINDLNKAYKTINEAIINSGSDDTISFAFGANPMVIVDNTLPWGLRQINKNELVLLSLPQDSLKCAQWGTNPLKAIKDEYILTESEITKIDNAIEGYNQYIAQLSISYPLAHVDIYEKLNYYNENTVYIDGIKFNTDFITGNIFSLDGIHLCPRGNALVAYYFIEAINDKFVANIPQLIIAAYPGIEFPHDMP